MGVVVIGAEQRDPTIVTRVNETRCLACVSETRAIVASRPAVVTVSQNRNSVAGSTVIRVFETSSIARMLTIPQSWFWQNLAGTVEHFR